MGSDVTRRATLTLAAALLAGGCAAMPPTRVVSADVDARSDAAEFYDRLDDVGMVSTADGVRAMNLFLASDAAGDYPQQVSHLKWRDLLARSFDASPDRALDRGTLARFVVAALGLPKGLTASVVGWSDRYALRELEFRGLIPPSSPNQTLSGTELIGILARAEMYRRDMARPAPGPGAPVAPPTRQNDVRPAGPGAPPAPVAGRPLPGVELASRSLDDMLVALAQAQSQPASGPAGDAFVFAEINGTVSVRPAGTKQKWRKVAAGDAVGDNTEITTLGESSAVVVGPKGQKYSFGSLTKSVLRAGPTEPGKVTTAIEVKRGDAGAEIDTTSVEAAGQQYDVQLRSPRSTLAIKGTRVALIDHRPFDVEAKSFTGTAVFENFQRQRVTFGKRNGGLVTVTGKTPDPTGVALSSAVADPGIRNARSDSEADLVANYFSRNTTVRFDRFSELPTITGGSVPDAAGLQSFFTGGLGFGVRWAGDANLNLEVIESPDDNGNGTGGPINRGRVIYPYGPLARQGEAKIPFDHRGGPNGGFEVVNLGDPVAGHYGLRVENLSTAATFARFDASLNGRPLLFYDPNSLRPASTSPKLTVRPGETTEFVVYYLSTPPSVPDLPGIDDGGIDLPVGFLVARPAQKSNPVRPAAKTDAKSAGAAKPAKIGPIAPPPPRAKAPKPRRGGR